MKNYITISVTSNDLNKRVDVFISSKLIDISRNRLKSLILAGNLSFCKEVIKQPSYKLKNTGNLSLFIPDFSISQTWITIFNILIGILFVVLLERLANRH